MPRGTDPHRRFMRVALVLPARKVAPMERSAMLAQVQSNSSVPHAEPGALDGFARGLGDVAATHALVIGERTLELVCLLIRRGCAAAGTLRWHEKAEPAAADLVVVSLPLRLQPLDDVLRQARRALLPGGRIVLLVAGKRPKALIGLVASTLRQYGFGPARLTATEGGMLVEAELPRLGVALHG